MSWMRTRAETWYPEETRTDGSQLGQRDGVSHMLAVCGSGQVPPFLWTCFFQTKIV